MSRTLLLVNTLTAIDSLVYGNHVEHLMASKAAYPEDKFLLFTPQRLSIDNARNLAATYAMAHECDYIMFVDDDVLLPRDAYARLKNADKDIVAGLTYIRSAPYNPMVFKEMESTPGKLSLEFWEPPKDELTEVYAVGFSCCLIKVDVLKALTPPYFITGPNQTEDVFFACKAKEELENVGVWVDTNVKTGHLQRPMSVHPDNVELWREFMKKLKPTKVEEEGDHGDRGEKYMNSIDWQADQ